MTSVLIFSPDKVRAPRVYHREGGHKVEQGQCEIELVVEPFPVGGVLTISLTGAGVTENAPGVNAGVEAHIDHDGVVRAADIDFTAQSCSVSYLANCTTHIYVPPRTRYVAYARVDPYGAQGVACVRKINAQVSAVFIPAG